MLSCFTCVESHNNLHDLNSIINDSDPDMKNRCFVITDDDIAFGHFFPGIASFLCVRRSTDHPSVPHTHKVGNKNQDIIYTCVTNE